MLLLLLLRTGEVDVGPFTKCDPDDDEMATATSGPPLPLVIVSQGLELAITKRDEAASLSTWNLDVV